MRILVVEDEPLIAMDLAESLELEGHEVLGPATTEAEALALCEGTLPELALLDIHLQEGNSGVVLAHVLHDRWGLLVIFTSAEAAEARQAREVALGYIAKPYRPETVLRSVELALRSRDGGRPACLPPGFEFYGGSG